jgi:hypothetical protein
MEATTMERPTTEARRDMTEYYDYWRSLSRDNAKLPAHLFLLHDLIRGKEPRCNSFSPITNKNKLANGRNTWSGLYQAKYALSYYCSTNVMMKMMLELSETSPEKIKIALSLIK